MTDAHRSRLRADCSSCFGLCCVATAFAAGADFAVDKPAGTPCTRLTEDYRCSIHDRLRQHGFPGCTSYDCFGAGQRISTITFGGRSWRDTPELAGSMFTGFGVLRRLHELLWYLHDAIDLSPSARLAAALAETERLAALPPDELLRVDVTGWQDAVNVLLSKVSEEVRGRGGRQARGADLAGRRLRGADLRRANLRGALLIGADLSTADLSWADVIGADFRATRLDGADLRTALFLTQAQLDAARGTASTLLPHRLTRPAHW